MSDEFNKNNEYLIFLSSSHSIIDNRIRYNKSLDSDSASIKKLDSFQNCKKLITELGISADGSGWFKIKKSKDNKYINFNSFRFIESDLNKKCEIKPNNYDNKVKLKCINEYIKVLLIKKASTITKNL